MDREGSLNLLRLGPDPSTAVGRYALTYAPYDRGGGALPARRVQGEVLGLWPLPVEKSFREVMGELER